MEILQIVGLGLIVVMLAVILRDEKPELALQLSIAFGVIIFIFLLEKIAMVVGVLQQIATRAEINSFYLMTLLKIIGVAYIAEFGAQICRDAGEGAVAAKLEFAAKVLVMIMAVPIIVAILETIMRLLPS